MSAQEQTEPNGWRVFHGTGSTPDTPPDLHQPPPRRRFGGAPSLPMPAADVNMPAADVNAALLLRRPLLITGPPGVGKSTLVDLFCRELGLGRALEWNIVSRTGCVDEFDKSDIDLPNDLLHVLENGSPEEAGLVSDAADNVRADRRPGAPREVCDGRVECREFPAAFRRRCPPAGDVPLVNEQFLAMVEEGLIALPQGMADLMDDVARRARADNP